MTSASAGFTRRSRWRTATSSSPTSTAPTVPASTARRSRSAACGPATRCRSGAACCCSARWKRSPRERRRWCPRATQAVRRRRSGPTNWPARPGRCRWPTTSGRSSRPRRPRPGPPSTTTSRPCRRSSPPRRPPVWPRSSIICTRDSPPPSKTSRRTRRVRRCGSGSPSGKRFKPCRCFSHATPAASPNRARPRVHREKTTAPGPSTISSSSSFSAAGFTQKSSWSLS